MLAIAVLAVAAVGLTGASGATRQLGRFHTFAGGTITGSAAQLSLSNKMTTYILEMRAKPVSVVVANRKAAGRGPLSFAQRAALTRQIAAQQAPVIAAVNQLNRASVTERFQGVYNGIAVTLPEREAWRLSSISGVTAVFASKTFTVDTAPGDGIPLVNAPQTWGGTGAYNGTGIKIADVDTGIDYTHADFGGDGLTSSYQCALANDAADPSTVSCDGHTMDEFIGPSAPKVKGGTDLVGDAYNSSGTGGALVPNPDPNPLDCASSGHGTHTAGTVAGFGVDDSGNTYTGTYDANTINNSFTSATAIPPGVAPKASLYSVRVFGCGNATTSDAVLIDAMNWAFNNGMDVVTMSIGAPFGSPNDPDSVAATNLTENGVILVNSSGNSGPNPYMTGSPDSATGSLAVAANDSTQQYPGATLALTKADTTSGGNLTALDANGWPISAGTYNLKVMYSSPGVISLGCPNPDGSNSDGPDNSLPANTIIVVARGTCARVAKAIFGQKAGAAGVIMVNNSTLLPPYEGPITGDPDAAGPPLYGGFAYNVTIPFLGVTGGSSPSTSANGAALIAADGGTVTLGATSVNNPGYLALASFTSYGPTAGGLLKPDVTGPGVAIISAGMGQGNHGAFLSGTSMSTPHAAGIEALVKEAHPSWGAVHFYKDAVANTANPANVAGYPIRGAGAGEINAYNATHTNVVADGSPTGTASLSFGVPDFTKGYKATETIHLTNFSSTKVVFTVGKASKQGIKHTLSCTTPNSWTPTRIVVPAHGTADLPCTLIVYKDNASDPVTRFGDWWGSHAFDDAAGLVTFTPYHQTNHNIPLVVPYYAVPTAVSNVSVSGLTSAALANGATANAVVTDKKGNPGYADYFLWGGTSDVSVTDIGSADLLNVGVSSTGFTGSTSTSFVTFALQTTKSWTNPAEDTAQIDVDVNGDTVPDYSVYSFDHGQFTAGAVDGEAIVIVCSDVTGSCVSHYLTGAMFDGTTMELPVRFSDLCRPSTPCVTSGVPIRYVTIMNDRNGGQDTIGTEDNSGNITSAARAFDIYAPTLSNNGEDFVTRNATVTDPTTINQAAWAANPQLGILVLEQDNQNTIGEAQTFALSF